MAIKIITTRLQKEGTAVQIYFNLIDDIAPLVILSSNQVSLTIPNGLTDQQMRTFVATETMKVVQIWYNVWKVNAAKETVNNTTRTGLETYINNNIIL